MLKRWAIALMALAVALFPRAACGHATGENYVWLNVDETRLIGRFEVRLADLRSVLGLTIPEDYDEANAVVQGLGERVQPYLLSKFLMVGPSGPITLNFGDIDLLRSPKMGHFARFHFTSDEMDVPDEIMISNELFLDGNPDPRHRSLICMEYNKKTGATYTVEVEDPAEGEIKTRRASFTAMVFAPHKTEQTLDLMRVVGVYGSDQFFKLGVKQLPKSSASILLALALLLPTVLYRPTLGGELRGADGPIRAIGQAVAVFVVFGLCLTIAYALSAWGLIDLPDRLVGAGAALSLAVVAANNVRSFVGGSAFVLFGAVGVVHGLWLAESLAALPFRMQNLDRIVVYFGAGFDAAVAAMTTGLFLILYVCRGAAWYQRLFLRAGSAVMVLVAMVWFIQRAFLA